MTKGNGFVSLSPLSSARIKQWPVRLWRRTIEYRAVTSGEILTRCDRGPRTTISAAVHEACGNVTGAYLNLIESGAPRLPMSPIVQGYRHGVRVSPCRSRLMPTRRMRPLAWHSPGRSVEGQCHEAETISIHTAQEQVIETGSTQNGKSARRS